MGITEIASLTVGLAGSLLYYRENKKHKQADTRSIDVESLTKTIKVLENERESLLNRMQSQIDDMERRMKLLQDELDTMKITIKIIKYYPIIVNIYILLGMLTYVSGIPINVNQYVYTFIGQSFITNILLILLYMAIIPNNI